MDVTHSINQMPQLLDILMNDSHAENSAEGIFRATLIKCTDKDIQAAFERAINTAPEQQQKPVRELFERYVEILPEAINILKLSSLNDDQAVVTTQESAEGAKENTQAMGEDLTVFADTLKNAQNDFNQLKQVSLQFQALMSNQQKQLKTVQSLEKQIKDSQRILDTALKRMEGASKTLHVETQQRKMVHLSDALKNKSTLTGGQTGNPPPQGAPLSNQYNQQ